MHDMTPKMRDVSVIFMTTFRHKSDIHFDLNS